MFFIRSAIEADLTKLNVLLTDTWQTTYTPFYGPQKVDAMIAAWHSLPALKDRLHRPNAEFLVADDGQQLAGMAYAAMSRNSPRVANLNQLYVHPHWQSQGIGTDLFSEVETCFPDAEIMRLQVTAENDRAIGFYHKVGFVEIGKVDNVGHPGSGIPALVMEKKLAF
jgi:ribosomal protein S18 acetylase RimI-like enzyme